MAGGNNYGNRLDNRQRGNATQLLEKYRALARDAQQAGDRVTAEYYLQYAEHYYRVLGDYRDRQPEGRGDSRGRDDRGRDGYEDDALDSQDAETDAADAQAGDSGEDGGDAADRQQRDDRGRDDLGREDRNREARGRDRNRDDRANDRQRDDRGRDDQGRRDWQRDRRERRSESPRATGQDAAGDAGDDRESLLQALPPPVVREAAPVEGRRLSLKREPAPEPVAPPVADVADGSDDSGTVAAAPKRRGRPRKAVAEPAAE
jgi:hypothetical protein